MSGLKENIAVFTTAKNELIQKTIPHPTCGDEDCIVHVRCTGICGSDVHYWKEGHVGEYVINEDLILGHESAGEVIQVGKNVKNGLKVGDRVSIEPQISCGKCDQCLKGRYNLCPDIKFFGTPPVHGSLARYIAHPAHLLFKLPDDVPYKLGALIEPLSVALAGCQRSGLKLGQPAIVCGAGPIGVLSLICALAAGAFPICVVDISPNRVEYAKKLGAHCTVHVDRSWDERKTASEIRKAIDEVAEGVIPEVALECTGAKSSIYSAVYALQEGGTLMQIGCGDTEIMFPIQSVCLREIDVRSLFRYTNTWPTLVRMLKAKTLKGVEDVITHTIDLKDAEKAFKLASDPSSGAIKVDIVDYD